MAVLQTHAPRLKRRDSALSKTAPQLLLNLLTLGLLAVVVLFVEATSAAERQSSQGLPLSGLLKTDVSTTLAVVRTAQGLLSAISALAVKNSFTSLHWKMMSSPNGLRYLNLLALSPTTEILGTFALLRSAVVRSITKLLALSRVALTLLLGLSGLVLFFDTSFITVYDTADVYDATAGVGPFNASLIQPFINLLQSTAPSYAYQVLPFTYYAAVYILVANPLISTISESVHCPGDSTCASYLLSGGLEMVAPWVPQGYDGYGMVKIDHAPSIQIDFSRPMTDTFEEEDCSLFGQTGSRIGIRLCVAQDQSASGSLRAGLFVCGDGIDQGARNMTVPRPNITTAVSFYTRQATIVAARSNYSILSVEETTTPILIPDVDLAGYRKALAWLLNYTAADIPGPSSIAQSFWSSGAQPQSPSSYGILEQNFQSILAFPFWLFKSNNWANTILRSNELVEGLRPQFYTKASVVAPHVKIKFNQTMFILFLVLQGLTIVFLWGVLAWEWLGRRTLPLTSSFPLYDAAFRARVDGEAWQLDMVNASNSEIVDIMKDARATAKAE
ncbi:hypothetical protein NKR23_g5763 [Pleurostoma richardsiae]|uniref:Uncharacterized protein n=1 Tax=Pleurostoma richardsiae TaxID=41990 RepID=A0AA38VQ73_9PEZI|nr:hypothetical protein NKR23_g5763 [Pleurostoma richardsiae]